MKQKIKTFFLNERNQRDIIKALFAGFVLTVVFSFFPFLTSCEEISDNVFRLHVIANSDSAEDQELKLKVRDAVLEESAKWYRDAETFEEANAALCIHLQSIENAARETVEEQGRSDTVRASVTDMYFETRDYGSFALPAGTYRTLRVTIGSGEGKNWWCMVYPSLCLPAAEKKQEEILSVLPEDESEIIGNPKDYQIKFKFVEWYEELKNFFSGK